jgi:hypothetical protein
MSREELDEKFKDLAKEIDETPLDDIEKMLDVLTRVEHMRKEFVKLYELESK